MTWLGDKIALPQPEIDKLKARREVVVAKIQEMQKLNGTHKSPTSARFHLEDLTKLAKDVISIDRKLGRV